MTWTGAARHHDFTSIHLTLQHETTNKVFYDMAWLRSTATRGTRPQKAPTMFHSDPGTRASHGLAKT